MTQLPNIQTFLSNLSTALTMAYSPYLMCEPMYLGDERFQRWPSPAKDAGPQYLTFCFAISKYRNNQPPFTLNFPSDHDLYMKKEQSMRNRMPDVNLAGMSGDNFMDDIPWPDYHDIEIPPISENQLKSIGRNMKLLESELLGPIKGSTINDEDFIFTKLNFNHKRTKEDPLEHIPCNYFEHKFFDGREQSFDSAVRAGEGPAIPEWTHQGFDINDEEQMASLDRREIQKALRSYDATYRANYFNPDLVPEKRLGSSRKSGAMTNWYRKGPIGRSRKPPPKPRQDVAERISQDHLWLLQQESLAKSKDNEDVQMGGTSVIVGGSLVGTEVIGGMSATIDAPGPSGFNSGFGQMSTITGALGSWGYNSSSVGVNSAPAPEYNFTASIANNAAGPSEYNFGAASTVLPTNTSTAVANNTRGALKYSSGAVSSAAPMNAPMISINDTSQPSAHNFGPNARNVANTAPGPSGYNSGTIGCNNLSSMAAPSGYTSAPGINNTINTAASSLGHNTLSAPTPREIGTRGSGGTNTLSNPSRPISDYDQGYTKSWTERVMHNYAHSFPAHAASIPLNMNLHNTIEVQSQGITHRPNLPTAAASAPVHASEEILETPFTSQEPDMENLIPINKKMDARDDKDEDWQPGQKPKPKPKATRKTAISKAATANPTTPKTITRKTPTPRTRKPKIAIPSVAGPIATSPTVGTPNLIKPAGVPRARNSRAATAKTVGPKSAVPKATAPRTATTRTSAPKTATPKVSATRATSKSNTPKPSSSTSTPSLKAPVTRKSSLKKSISGESADGTWEPDEEDL
ncbi:uncharacterized protein EAE97_005146 [Botrytis byssoidea]|uniref:Uncharacterized protein n=1 Tax=Botrytis byssoidea TaxID=139641 RepID=A0A9P5IUH3_9HELO|nr:uncharacterized protein EAE97_005146 [Botrytis byssoidea]KAF7946108.1 hypothetical protein EAE97_005146 [Botrytis byssoidea]